MFPHTRHYIISEADDWPRPGLRHQSGGETRAVDLGLHTALTGGMQVQVLHLILGTWKLKIRDLRGRELPKVPS